MFTDLVAHFQIVIGFSRLYYLLSIFKNWLSGVPPGFANFRNVGFSLGNPLRSRRGKGVGRSVLIAFMLCLSHHKFRKLLQSILLREASSPLRSLRSLSSTHVPSNLSCLYANIRSFPKNVPYLDPLLLCSISFSLRKPGSRATTR